VQGLRASGRTDEKDFGETGRGRDRERERERERELPSRWPMTEERGSS